MINNLFKTVALVSLLVCSAAQAEIIAVVNNANATALTKNDVSRIFLGKMKKYTPVNMSSGNALRAEFNKKALKKSSNQVKAYWSKLVFSGKGTPPKELASDAEIKAFVASNPNAIGYIDIASLDGTVKAALTL